MDKLRRTFTGSASGALAALLMVGAIAFGATVIRPMTADRSDGPSTAMADDTAAAQDGTGGGTGTGNGTDATRPAGDVTDGWMAAAICQDEQGNPIPCIGASPGETPGGQPVDTPAETPAQTPVEAPKDTPKEEPSNPPAPSEHLTLAAVFNADLGKVVVEWSAFGGDFQKYKLVRSTDGAATWPLGPGDTLAAVVQPADARRFVDEHAPCNTVVFYRAFAVVHVGDGYTVLASSNVGSATRACDVQTPAEPMHMSFQVVQTADGVKLDWHVCASGAFVAYKVVRSATNPNPTFPLNDGTELIGVVGDQGTASSWTPPWRPDRPGPIGSSRWARTGTAGTSSARPMP